MKRLIATFLFLLPFSAHAIYFTVPKESRYAPFYRTLIRGSGRTTQQQNGLVGDVPDDHENAEAIEYVLNNGMMKVDANGLFRPSEMVTRGAFTSIVVDRIFSLDFIEECFANISFPYPPNYALLFSDLLKEGEEAKRICAGLMAGVVHGYDDGTFRAEREVNLVEASKILLRAYDVSFLPYRGEGDRWFALYVEQLAGRSGIPLAIEGLDGVLSRADAAEMLYRLDANITTKPSWSWKDLLASALRFVAEAVAEWF